MNVLFDFQESLTSPAAQQGADGHKADDQRRLDTDTTATAQDCENETEWKVWRRMEDSMPNI